MSLQPEQIEHINVVNWFNYQFPELSDDLHHFANERKCSVQQGRTLKRMGVKKGVADFFLALPINGKSGLWIELKVGKNKPTQEQIAFAERKINRNYEFAFVWGFEAAKEIILIYLKSYIANRSYNVPKNMYNDKPIC
jgi:hypothetical protein